MAAVLGVAVLFGAARTRARVADVVRRVPGVKSVRNELKAQDARAAAAPR